MQIPCTENVITHLSKKSHYECLGIVKGATDAEIKKYSIKFFDNAEKQVIEISKLHETYLTLEKVNFSHAGWYYYELYEKGKLVEKNKFYLPKDQNSQSPPNNEKGKKNR